MEKNHKMKFWKKISTIALSCFAVIFLGTALSGCGEKPSSTTWQISPSAPTAETAGETGAMYLDTSNFDLYVKTDSGWQLLGSIKGTNGTNGNNGANANLWIVGDATPEEETGLTGDLFLDTVTGNIYQKSETGWGDAIGNIRGTAGKNANVWIVGETNPTPSTPAVKGDIYLNTVTGDYFQKGDLDWTQLGTLKGENGKNGQDANQWFVNNGEPSANLGDETDMYLDTNTGNIYKKGPVAWALVGNFNGNDGKDANMWIVGSENPTVNTEGNINDLYFNKTTGDIYQKLQAGTWAHVSNIKGTNGNTWSIGETNPSNNNGTNGDLYLHTTSYDIYQKIDGAWIKVGNLKGETGTTWTVDGQDPTKNTQGNIGDLFLNSVSGDIFKLTQTGWEVIDNIRCQWFIGEGTPSNTLQSHLGDIYLNKTNGDLYQRIKSGNNLAWSKVGNIKGENGQNANAWLSGAGQPAQEIGNNNDFYIDSDTYNVYSKTNNQWELFGNIRGTQGESGTSLVSVDIEYSVDSNNHTIAIYKFTLSNDETINITTTLPADIASIQLAPNYDSSRDWTIPFWTTNSTELRIEITYSDGTTLIETPKKSMFDINFETEGEYKNFKIHYQGKEYIIPNTLIVYNPDEATVDSISINKYNKMIWYKNGSEFEIPKHLISFTANFPHSSKTVYLDDPNVTIQIPTTTTLGTTFTATITYKGQKSTTIEVIPVTELSSILSGSHYEYSGKSEITSVINSNNIFNDNDYIEILTSDNQYYYLVNMTNDLLVNFDNTNPIIAQEFSINSSALYGATPSMEQTITVTLYNPDEITSRTGKLIVSKEYGNNSYQLPYLATVSDINEITDAYIELYINLNNGTSLLIETIDFDPTLITSSPDFSSTDTNYFAINYKGEKYDISVELYNPASPYKQITAIKDGNSSVTFISPTIPSDPEHFAEHLKESLLGFVLEFEKYEPIYLGNNEYSFIDSIEFNSQTINLYTNSEDFDENKINIDISMISPTQIATQSLLISYHNMTTILKLNLLVDTQPQNPGDPRQYNLRGTALTFDNMTQNMFGYESVLLLEYNKEELGTDNMYPLVARVTTQEGTFDFTFNDTDKTNVIKINFPTPAYFIIDESESIISPFIPTGTGESYTGILNGESVTVEVFDSKYVVISNETAVIATVDLKGTSDNYYIEILGYTGTFNGTSIDFI